MAKNKYDFIKEILESKKMTPAQRERVLLLTMKEIKSENSKDEELIRRLEEVEKKIKDFYNNQKIKIENKSSSIEKKNFSEPNPKHVADFMSLFNQRDGLKYLTHDYDENDNFEINKFLISAHSVFTESTMKLKIPQSLWRIVKQFAFDSQQTEWTSISENYKKDVPVKIGWATKELRNWSKQNLLHPIRNEEYEKMIRSFKRITRIEKYNLEKLIHSTIEDIFKDELEEFVIETNNLEKADFYSHVGFLKSALETIFEEIIKYSTIFEQKKISISYERSSSDDGYFLRKVIITHHNSFPTKELKVLLKEWQEKGNMGKIKEKLRGYCHWSVETMIEDNSIKVNILRDKETPEYEEIKSNINGFTHILTFYYK